jgi:hypothetical protein
MMTFYRYAAAALVLSLPSCTESLNDPLPSPIDDTVVVAVDSKGNNSTAFTMIAGSSRSLAV